MLLVCVCLCNAAKWATQVETHFHGGMRLVSELSSQAPVDAAVIARTRKAAEAWDTACMKVGLIDAMSKEGEAAGDYQNAGFKAYDAQTEVSSLLRTLENPPDNSTADADADMEMIRRQVDRQLHQAVKASKEAAVEIVKAAQKDGVTVTVKKDGVTIPAAELADPDTELADPEADTKADPAEAGVTIDEGKRNGAIDAAKEATDAAIAAHHETNAIQASLTASSAAKS